MVERNVKICIQVTFGVTYKLTVKEVVVAHFAEILLCTFDFID